jgi:hypothetical protein
MHLVVVEGLKKSTPYEMQMVSAAIFFCDSGTIIFPDYEPRSLLQQDQRLHSLSPALSLQNRDEFRSPRNPRWLRDLRSDHP